MFARVTSFEIDTTQIDLDGALAAFEEMVLADLRAQPGYAGLYVLGTPEGRGLLVSLWTSEEAAHAGIANGFYGDQLAKFREIVRTSPGRSDYAVLFSEHVDGTDVPESVEG